MILCGQIRAERGGQTWAENTAIEHVCEGYALDIVARKQSVYDFWTGTNGIGDGWIPSDLKGLAAQEAQQ